MVDLPSGQPADPKRRHPVLPYSAPPVYFKQDHLEKGGGAGADGKRAEVGVGSESPGSASPCPPGCFPKHLVGQGGRLCLFPSSSIAGRWSVVAVSGKRVRKLTEGLDGQQRRGRWQTVAGVRAPLISLSLLRNSPLEATASVRVQC